MIITIMASVIESKETFSCLSVNSLFRFVCQLAYTRNPGSFKLPADFTTLECWHPESMVVVSCYVQLCLLNVVGLPLTFQLEWYYSASTYAFIFLLLLTSAQIWSTGVLLKMQEKKEKSKCGEFMWFVPYYFRNSRVEAYTLHVIICHGSNLF